MRLDAPGRGSAGRRRRGPKTRAGSVSPARQPLRRYPKIVYVINAFDQGGAELGLLTLVRNGLFAGCRLKVVALVRGRGGLEEQLRAMGLEPRILIDRPRMRTKDLLRALPLLWRTLRRERPQIVIGSLPQANLLARLCVLLDRRTTFVSFEHNSHLARPVYETGYRLTSWRVDWMFADAAPTAAAAEARLYRRAPRRRTVVPLVSFAGPATWLYLPDDGRPFHIVNAARFTPTKNQAALIEAVALLVADGRDVALTLYGDGAERRACETSVERFGLEGRVRFPGFVPGWADRGGDLFVLTSRHEGLCIVALEAMHAGIPVVAPRIGALAEHADAGLIRDVESVAPSVVADTIAAAMDDRAGTTMMVARAAQMVDRCYGAGAIRDACAGINRALITVAGGRARPRPRSRRTPRPHEAR